MNEQPDTHEHPLKHRDPAAPLSPAHKTLITILAELLVVQYLAVAPSR
jgi:hypothetical protein